MPCSVFIFPQVSYDFVEVTKHTEPLETETLHAGTDFALVTPMPLKVYKGTSVMNLVKTLGVGGDSDVAHTWSNLVTSTEQPAPEVIGACCYGGSVPGPTFVNADGSTYSGTFPSCGTGTLPSNYFVTTLQAAPTMTVVTVHDPLDIGTIAAYIGGWLGILELAAVVFLKFTWCIHARKPSADVAKSDDGDIELGDETNTLKPANLPAPGGGSSF